MVSISANELERGNLPFIITTIILSGLGLYLALILANTITTTVNSILPPQDSPVAAAWINLAIAFILVVVLVFILIRLRIAFIAD